MKVKTRHYSNVDSMPACLQDFLYSLRQLSGVREVRRCDLLKRNQNQPFQTRVQHYEHASRTLSVKAESGPYIAFFRLKIDPAKQEEVENHVESYLA